MLLFWLYKTTASRNYVECFCFRLKDRQELLGPRFQWNSRLPTTLCWPTRAWWKQHLVSQVLSQRWLTVEIFSAPQFAVFQQVNQFLLLGSCFVHVPPIVCTHHAHHFVICTSDGFIIHQNCFQRGRRDAHGLHSRLPVFPRHHRFEEFKDNFYVEMKEICLASLQQTQDTHALVWPCLCVKPSQKAASERKCQISNP